MQETFSQPKHASSDVRVARVQKRTRLMCTLVSCVRCFMCAAFHPDSVTKLKLFITQDFFEPQVVEWEGAPGSVELQEVTGLQGANGTTVVIGGILPGEYLGILEVSAKNRARERDGQSEREIC